MREQSKEPSSKQSENRKALPKFALTMAGSLLAGGVLGFFIGLSHIFGLESAALAEGQIGRASCRERV